VCVADLHVTVKYMQILSVALNCFYSKLAGVPGAARDGQWRNLIT